MKIEKISNNNLELIQKLLVLHDEYPGEAWDQGHRPSTDWVLKTLEKIQKDPSSHHFWVLGDSEKDLAGFIWAKTELNRFQEKVCNVSSLWIDPSLPKKNLSRLLTDQMLSWAKENHFKKIICATHQDNSRMRKILEEIGPQGDYSAINAYKDKVQKRIDKANTEIRRLEQLIDKY